MSIHNLIHRKKQEKPGNQEANKPGVDGTYEEQLHELTMEMACGYGMLPPCGFPDVIWHLY